LKGVRGRGCEGKENEGVGDRREEADGEGAGGYIKWGRG